MDNDGRRPGDVPAPTGFDPRDFQPRTAPLVTIPASSAEGPSETQGEGGVERMRRARKSRQENVQLVLDAAGLATLDQSLSFVAASVSVDNLSTRWVYFPDFDMFVPPYTVGAVGSYSAGANKARIVQAPPNGFAQPAVAAAGQVVRATFYEDEKVESAGLAISATAAGSLSQTVIIGDGAGTASLAALLNVQGGIAGLAVTTIPPTINSFAPLTSPAAAAQASRVVKAAPGRVFRLDASNGNAAIRFLQLFDANALPADGTVPQLSIPMPIGGGAHIDFGIYGRVCANGIVVCNSSTQNTKTLGAADSLFDLSYL